MSIIYGFCNTLREHYSSANQTTRSTIRFAVATAFVSLLATSIEAWLPAALIGAALTWGMYVRLCALGGASVKSNVVRFLIVGVACNALSSIGGNLLNTLLTEALRWSESVSTFIVMFAGTYLAGRLFVVLFNRKARQASCAE